MTDRLFNLLNKLRQIRDTIVTRGPVMLDSVAGVFAMLEDGTRQVSDFIRNLGPAVQFMPGGGAQYAEGVDGGDFHKHLEELNALKAEVDAEFAAADQQLTPEMAQAGIRDFLGRIDPETKKFILGILSKLIGQILTANGIPVGLFLSPQAGFVGAGQGVNMPGVRVQNQPPQAGQQQQLQPGQAQVGQTQLTQGHQGQQQPQAGQQPAQRAPRARPPQ